VATTSPRLDEDHGVILEAETTMTQIVLPDSVISQLAGLPGPTSICDSSGQIVGTYIPQVASDAELYRKNPCPLTPGELERRRKEKGGQTLAEFWKEMGVTVGTA
jgi:hypothetical protein